MRGRERQGTILVVDDEAPIVRIVEVNLRIEGYQVVTAYGGEEALQRLEEERPDLVVLDVLMPDMDGWAVLEKMRSQPETAVLPVILLTGLGQDADIEQGKVAGCSAYVTKPSSPAELLATVKRTLKDGMKG